MSGPRAIVHGTRFCIWCLRAQRLLEARGIAYEYVDVTGDRAARAELRARTGRSTVPQIWLDGRWVGGFDELEALDDRGGLVERTA